MKKYCEKIPSYDRNMGSENPHITTIGNGEIGGKATGLCLVSNQLNKFFKDNIVNDFNIQIPRFTVITTSYFEHFMKQNELYEIALSDMPDERIAYYFQKADLPVNLLGDLRTIAEYSKRPLAVRSSSLLEDSLETPFAGTYETKMIPNNLTDRDLRFKKLSEAVKFVYASVFFRKAKDYARSTGNDIKDEKMAVIIQEVAGSLYGERFYPEISGVARSYNFYPFKSAKPEDGVVNLALGLGKAIVDGSLCWSYSPSRPRNDPPFGSVKDMMKNTQTTFWTINMGKTVVYDPVKETEYLKNCSISDAEYDNCLKYVASTYDSRSDRIKSGVGVSGPRVVNFAPMLKLESYSLNDTIKKVLSTCEEIVGNKVEIEFAVSFKDRERPLFALLQAREMAVSDESVELSDNEMNGDDVLLSSENALGNGIIDNITDVVYVNPDTFNFANSREIAKEIESINSILLEQNKKYVLIGFGRWGSSDHWLGIPVVWGNISATAAIIESNIEGKFIELSQGSHFFHNLSNLKIPYFSLSPHEKIDFDYLKSAKVINKTDNVIHVKLDKKLNIKVDGKKRRGVIIK